MKYRKELLHKQYHQSDILNIKTGYYKTENIYPITPKPTESNKKIKEFIPHYKEIKPRLRLYNDLLGHFNNKTFIINDLKLPLKRQYSEIQNLRKYNKTISLYLSYGLKTIGKGVKIYLEVFDRWPAFLSCFS